MLKTMKQKSISPLISIILLIVVAIVIITMVLSWGKGFTTSSVSKTNAILEEDTTTLDFEDFSRGNLYFKNISPIGTEPVTITGYSIISPTHHRLLNTLNNLDENITLNPGQTTKINIPTPPETDFYVNLYTSDNTYIKLSDIKKSKDVEPFTKTFYGGGNNYGISVEQTTDGGYIITGYTSSGSNNDVWLIKTDSSGNEDWNKLFDGGSGDDRAYSVEQTTDGGYIITGYTSSGLNNDVWLIKTDSSGNEDWNKTFDGGSGDDGGKFVIQTADGGYIILGNTDNSSDNDIWLIKTDSDGNEDWNKIFDSGSTDYGYSLEQTTDGGYIIAGKLSSTNSDVWIIKTDSEGNEDWNKNFDGGVGPDYARSIKQTTDGGYIIGGEVSTGSGDAAWLIKIDSSGNEDWNKTFTDSTFIYSVDKTTDGGYILSTRFPQYGGGPPRYYLSLIKTDSSGDEDWNKIFNEGSSNGGYFIERTTDGGYVITGYYGSYVWLLKTDSEGNT